MTNTGRGLQSNEVFKMGQNDSIVNEPFSTDANFLAKKEHFFAKKKCLFIVSYVSKRVLN